MTNSAKQKMLRMKTQARFPFLIEITHTSYGTYRYANCDDNITFDGNTYSGCVFSLSLPDIGENPVGNGTLNISAVDQTWIEKIRGTQERAKLKFIAVIDYDDEHEVQQVEEIDTFEYELVEANWTEESISWEMRYDDGMDIVCPCDITTPQKVSGCV